MVGMATFATAVSALLGAVVVAQTTAPGVMALTPAGMNWSLQGGLALPGLEQVNLVGDPARPGPYTVRLKFPKGFRIALLSGTHATGYGETFNVTNLKILPAGSFYTEPANVPHYIAIMEDAVLQVSGMGPSGRKLINPSDNPQ